MSLRFVNCACHGEFFGLSRRADWRSFYPKTGGHFWETLLSAAHVLWDAWRFARQGCLGASLSSA